MPTAITTCARQAYVVRCIWGQLEKQLLFYFAGDETFVSVLSQERQEMKELFRQDNKELREQDTKLQQGDDQLRRKNKQLQEQIVEMREGELQKEMNTMKKEIKKLRKDNEKLRHVDRRQRYVRDGTILGVVRLWTSQWGFT